MKFIRRKPEVVPAPPPPPEPVPEPECKGEPQCRRENFTQVGDSLLSLDQLNYRIEILTKAVAAAHGTSRLRWRQDALDEAIALRQRIYPLDVTGDQP